MFDTNGITALLALVLLLLLGGILGTWLVGKLREFLQELHTINMEIKRSEDEEQAYWKEEKRRLIRRILLPCKK